jgi:outer membrane receptor protein involved in Fe transport
MTREEGKQNPFGGSSMITRIFIILISVLLIVNLSASTGKLSGIVKDQSTGEPLIGVNILINGTFLGGSTDEDGYYVILNVPAGKYTVVFNYIGYKEVRVENVRVVLDITKRLDVTMQESVLEADSAVVVVADKPFFEATATNTVRVLEAEEIENSPIKGVNSIVAMNAGVVIQDGSGGDTDAAEINVRGGRGNETLIIVDGVPYNDVLFGNATGTIPDVSIAQVSSQLGGFSAKYGSAQSGIVNITTKSGAAKFFLNADLVSSSLTDNFNYNSITGAFGGPMGSRKLSYFFSGEYLTTDDSRPRVSGLIIPTANIDQDPRKDMDSELIRGTGKLTGQFGQFKTILSGNMSVRDFRSFVHGYSKNNSAHNPRSKEDVFGGSFRFSHIVNPTTFWDLTLRGKFTGFTEGDGVWYKDVEAYGDSARNAEIGVHLTADGQRVGADDVGVFWANGRVFNRYRQYEILTGGLDFNFTNQYKNHLLEIGALYEQHQVRFYDLFPRVLAIDKDSVAADIRYNNAIGVFYGYDIFGNKISDSQTRQVGGQGGDEYEEAAPKRPTIAGAYFQDRIEFRDFTINLGLRWDYFKADHFRFKDIEDIYGFGSNPNRLDAEDLEDMPAESYISPRIGFAFQMTERTVFHAQYGVFRQPPRFFDIYDSWNNLQIMEERDGQGQNHGWIEMEKTTAYEFGFKQQIGTIASLDLTAYYKNIEGLINLNTIRSVFGQTNRTYISTNNQDFGTIKGLTFSFNLRRLHGVTTRIDYTLALSEGTGSDPSSSRNATFRNPNNEVPLAIAPLDFDERHTLNFNVDVRAGRGKGILSEAGTNIVFTFTSGRPYTPVASQNPLPGVDQSLFGSETTQYINSAYAGDISRFDLRLDKQFHISRFALVPYLWIQNIFDRDNFVAVWRSTGKPDNSAWKDTPEGQHPSNYGLPRLIRLGLKVKF